MLSFTGRLLALSLAVSSVSAIPVPNPQTADPSTLEACPQSTADGSIVCSADGSSFFVCNYGKKVPMGAVAAGTICKNGMVVGVDSPAVPNPPAVVPAPPNKAPMPTTVVANPQPIANGPGGYQPNPPAVPPASTGPVTSTILSTVYDVTSSTSTVYVTVSGVPPSSANSAAPTYAPAPTGGATSPVKITEQVVLAVAPSSNTCSGASFPDECNTAKEAVPFIAAGFEKFQINTIGEAAALLSIMAFESGDFKFNINHFPGRPGQGTKAMLMANFIVSYAQTFGSTDNIAPGLSSSNIDAQSDDIKNKVRAVVLSNERTFAAAAWFYSDMCSESVKAGLRKGPTIAAWTDYITQCVGTTVTEDRTVGYVKAVMALGGSTPA
ncbi:hypothetical protein DRE_00076 [Drechslerella stenobrocha 248]|uniref:Uncharacterized protein n=1 Tax=Drechslerella stenobrocha 248 TaxID=1043628 RepID=W7HX56_9PEZI|nr:hypothetical protein DRE_00076 [Drechslerella stenobrocha 248]